MDRATAFYRDTLGFPLDPEGDPDLLSFRCQLGDVGFSIALGAEEAASAVVLAISVVDLDAYATALRQAGVELLYPPRERDGVRMTAVRDPDGNLIELTEREGGAIEIAARPGDTH
jgi:catechol 2,3-dioxygenase-like lactoylglutathione lyase family enzyme